jgi:hypothetical protein
MFKIQRKKWVLCCLVFVSMLLYFLFLKGGYTYYAAGFDQRKFDNLHVGMSASELEKAIGPPLEKIPQRNGSVLWTYSGRPDVSRSFWRRWVFLKDDKITSIENDYWDD